MFIKGFEKLWHNCGDSENHTHVQGYGPAQERPEKALKTLISWQLCWDDPKKYISGFHLNRKFWDHPEQPQEASKHVLKDVLQPWQCLWQDNLYMSHCISLWGPVPLGQGMERTLWWLVEKSNLAWVGFYRSRMAKVVGEGAWHLEES